MTEPRFKIGDRVRKSYGDYHIGGEIRAVFTTSAGKLRYVVDHVPAVPGLLHIYSESQLEKSE